MKLRLCDEESVPTGEPLANFDSIFRCRLAEANEFYDGIFPTGMGVEERSVTRQAYAGRPTCCTPLPVTFHLILYTGLLWSKQFYHYIINAWLDGDPDGPTPPAERKGGRNKDWKHLFNRDIVSMPDKWEYPWVSSRDFYLDLF